jgi:hypothetical protein
MSAVSWKCLSCKRVVRPVRSQTGIAVCPKCSGVVALIEGRPMPTPRPVAVASARTRRGHRTAVGVAAASNGGAGSGLSSATWAPPSPVDAPSPASAADWRALSSSSTRDRITPDEAASRWTHSRSLWACAPAGAILLVIAAVMLVNRSAAGPHQSAGAEPTAGGSARTPSAAAAARGTPIDLMPIIDPARHTMGGKWARTADGLISDGSRWAKLRIPCDLPEEYDFRIEFTSTGSEDVAQVFALGGHTCAWLLGGFKGTVCGLHHVAGKPANANPTTVRDYTMTSGERHTSVLQVRRNSVAAILDGKPLMRHQTDGSDLSTNSNWDTGPKSLGIGSYQNSTVFHRVELIPVSK